MCYSENPREGEARFGSPSRQASELKAPNLGSNTGSEAARLWQEILVLIETYKISDVAFVEGLVWVGISKQTITLWEKDEISQDLYLAMLGTLTEGRAKLIEAIRADASLEQDFSCEMIRNDNGEKVRFRVNHFLAAQIPCVVMRPLPDKVPRADQIGFDENFVRRVTSIQNGIILFTGTTNSGKSTSIAALLDAFNEEHCYHIVTLEDPVEIRFKNKRSKFTQREVGEDTKDFFNGLRAAMRQAPHIIVVGEMRDYETITIACLAALTGHIVISTTHADGVAKAVSRLVDSAPPGKDDILRKSLANSLKLVIYQTLPRAREEDGGGRTCLREILWVDETAATTIMSKRDKSLNDYMRSHNEDGCQLFAQAFERERNNLHPDDAAILAARFADQFGG